MTYTWKSKIWLERDEQKVFGSGPLALLRRVERTGSLLQAAEEMSMSYSHAWSLIRSLEKKLGFPLLVTQAGGKGGGGSVLSPQGLELAGRYERFQDEADRVIQELFDRHFPQAPDSSDFREVGQ
jgi:molybdate transport system regulatory protein